MTSKKLHVAFDVGHSSIGWAVLNEGKRIEDFPSVLGCGSVIFQADDCLAVQRRAYRSQRRHIRATRQRIERMKQLVVHIRGLTREQADAPGVSCPWLLAARVLRGGPLLTWQELWFVLRWYAHNRGYQPLEVELEGGATPEDTEKVEHARALLKKHGTATMSETLCAVMGLDPLGTIKSSHVRTKGALDAAFPRESIEAEVGRILQAHIGKLRGVDNNFATALFSDWRAVPCPTIKIPARYAGGLLFGRLSMRYDNRIISKCPITGDKVPARKTPEFREFRWALLLANVKVGKGTGDLLPLAVADRKALDQRMRDAGAMTAFQFKNAVREVTGCSRDNLDATFMHPDADKALVLDPIRKATASNELLSAVWTTLSERTQIQTCGRLRRKGKVTLEWIREHMAKNQEKLEDFDAKVDALCSSTGKGGKKKVERTKPQLLSQTIEVRPEAGRAAYSRPILVQAAQEAMAGRDPRAEGGCLYVTDKIKDMQATKSLSEQTNNHLVRHRILILERLARDVIRSYADGNAGNIGAVTIEVNRDLRSMSGMTAKQRTVELSERMKAFKSASDYAEEALSDKPTKITAGLIRKVRIAQDLNWTCPYTGKKYGIHDILNGSIDKDHVVPRADRSSDSLDSLVLTFKAVNLMKKRRTALQFVEAEGGKPVEGMSQLSIVPRQRFEQFVEALDTKGHDDDRRRKKKRKDLLLCPSYEEKEFLPKDLTITSQLVRLAAQRLAGLFKDCKHPPRICSIPGSVTGSVRRSWSLLGCLREANPQVVGPDGELLTKTEIRDVTHLHHAVDACVLGLAGSVIPNDGAVWTAMVKRRPSPAEARCLVETKVFRRDSEGRFDLKPIPEELRQNISDCLAERRVVQHMPADMSGLKAEETVWRVVDFDDPTPSTNKLKSIIASKEHPPLNSTDTFAYIVKWVRKEKNAKAPSGIVWEGRSFWMVLDKAARSKLLGLNDGKLKRLKAAKVIGSNYGIALDPAPVVIPFHKVWHRLHELRIANRGKPVRVLRNGAIIRIAQGRYQGTWKIFSCKNAEARFLLDIAQPDVVRAQSGTTTAKSNVMLKTLLADGLELVQRDLAGGMSPQT